MNNFLFFSLFFLISNNVYSFEIYGRIPWSFQKNEVLISNQEEVKSILTKNGINEIDVVYHNRMLTNNEVDPEKIKKIASDSLENPDIPISFDYELGNRFKPETVLPNIIKIIDLYRFYGGKSKIGVYAMLPQNTYGGKNLTSEEMQKYDSLNKKYEELASKLDFLSPSFYFYDGKNFVDWKKSVDFNMKQSKLIAKKYNLKIYPYVTNAFITSKIDPITKGWSIELLSCKQMKQTIKYIEDRGANGVIIWNSSNVLTENDVKPIISYDQPWFKGVKKTCN